MVEKQISLNIFLRRLIWVSMLPLLILLGYFAFDKLRTLDAERSRDAADIASNVALAVDNTIAVHIEALQVLSESPQITAVDNFSTFYEEAKGFQKHLDGHVILSDLSMQMVFNTRVPLGTKLPKLPVPKGHAAAPTALKTGKPDVGDSFLGPVAHTKLIAIVVPVIREEQTKYLLLSIISAQQLQATFDQIAVPAEWGIRLLDSKGDVVAAKAPAAFSWRDNDNRQYVVQSTRSPWSIDLQVPPQAYQKVMSEVGVYLLILIGLGIIAGALISRLASRGLTRAMATLTEDAAPAEDNPHIREIETVRQKLTAANEAHAVYQQALREREQRFSDFATAAADMFWETDENHRITYLSSVQKDSNIVPERDIYGKRREEVAGIRYSQDVLDKMYALLDAHEPFKNFEYPFAYAGDDKERYVRNSAIPLFDQTGAFKGYRGAATDISELVRQQNALRHSQKMEEIGQLTGGVAHDFNNMLGVIMGNLDLLRDRVGNDSKALKFVDAAYRGVERGASITKKLLSFSREEPQTQTLTNVNQFISGMKEMIAKSLTPQIRVETNLADDIWPVNIDPGELEDMLLNLSLNARDAMPDGGVLVIETGNKTLDEVYTEANPGSAIGDHTMICVSDTGCGMSKEMIQHIFEPFFTTKSIHRGTGLGLSMVYGFVQRSHGHIKVYSEPGSGTTFRIYLPRADVHSGTLERPHPRDEEALPRGEETVLVVDDEKDLIDVAVSYLNSLGYKTLTACTPMEALDVLEHNPGVGLLFTDVIMPGDLDGYGLAKECLKKHPAIKVLLTSGFTAKRERAVNGDKLLFNKLSETLLSKPYNRAELAVAVRRALDAPL